MGMMRAPERISIYQFINLATSNQLFVAASGQLEPLTAQ
jgi:hypothetical protein